MEAGAKIWVHEVVRLAMSCAIDADVIVENAERNERAVSRRGEDAAIFAIKLMRRQV